VKDAVAHHDEVPLDLFARRRVGVGLTPQGEPARVPCRSLDGDRFLVEADPFTNAEAIRVPLQVAPYFVRARRQFGIVRIGMVRELVGLLRVVRPQARIGARCGTRAPEVGALFEDPDIEAILGERLGGDQSRDPGPNHGDGLRVLSCHLASSRLRASIVRVAEVSPGRVDHIRSVTADYRLVAVTAWCRHVIAEPDRGP
jgi:hypothetical protein